MKLRFINKTIANKKFSYTPMYYDEQKEYIELKKKQWQDLGEEKSVETRKEILRQELNHSRSRSQQARASSRSSNIRVLILIGLILALGYFLLNGLDDVDVVINKLWK